MTAYVTVTRYGTTNTAICQACGLADQHLKSVDAQLAATLHNHDHHLKEPTP